MQQAQIVHHGLDERLSESLRAFALHQGLHLREVASLKALLPLLAKHADASILVVQLGQHLERELALLEQVSAVVPQTAVVALLGLGNPLLAGLAGELGATVVLTPPHVKDRLEEVLLKLVTAQQAGEGVAMSKPVAQPWSALPLPQVDATRCSGCGLCVQVCPTDCLAMGRHVPWLARPLDCVRCGLCVAVCPVDALSLASV